MHTCIIHTHGTFACVVLHTNLHLHTHWAKICVQTYTCVLTFSANHSSWAGLLLALQHISTSCPNLSMLPHCVRVCMYV